MSKARDLADSTETLDVDGGTIKLDGNYPVGTGNVALGDAALDDPSLSGGYNTAIGNAALTLNSTGSNNTALGYEAGNQLTSGAQNTLVGVAAGRQTTTGNYNVGVGNGTVYATTTGSNNTGIGWNALRFNTTASNNTAVGYQAGYTNQTGSYNTFVGRVAGYSANNTGNVLNAFFGEAAGYSCTTGFSNTFIGANAGDLITTGHDNTILGRFNGNQGGLDIRTSSNNIVLSDGDGNPRVWVSNNGGFKSSNNGTFNQGAYSLRHEFNQGSSGEDTVVFINSSATPYGLWVKFSGASPNNTSQYFLQCSDSTTNRMRIYSNGDVVNSNNSYGAISDIKLKENVVDSGSQWDDIKSLRVRKYSMKADNLDAPNMLGVIAQEVEAAGMGGLVFESPDIDPDTKEDLETVTKQVNYSILYMKAVKALQEAMDRIETLETKVTALEAN
jgi:hypothetical protein